MKDARKKRLDDGLPPIPLEDKEGDAIPKKLFEVAVEEFILKLQDRAGKEEEMTAESADRFARILRNDWVPNLEGRALGSITKDMVQRIIFGWTCKDKTRKNALVPLRLMYKHFAFDINPANGIPFKKTKKNSNVSKVDRYSPEERELIINKLGEMERNGEGLPGIQLLAVLLFGGGFRTGEALALKWSDWDGKYMHVQSQILSEGKHVNRVKYGNVRYVHMPKWTHSYLTNAPTRFKKNGFILLNSRGQPYRSRKELYQIWGACHEALGLRYRDFYTCRHSRAAELISTGVDYGKAAKQLGHTPEMFLRTYSEWREDYARQHRDDSDLDGVGLHGTALAEAWDQVAEDHR